MTRADFYAAIFVLVWLCVLRGKADFGLSNDLFGDNKDRDNFDRVFEAIGAALVTFAIALISWLLSDEWQLIVQ